MLKDLWQKVVGVESVRPRNGVDGIFKFQACCAARTKSIRVSKQPAASSQAANCNG